MWIRQCHTYTNAYVTFNASTLSLLPAQGSRLWCNWWQNIFLKTRNQAMLYDGEVDVVCWSGNNWIYRYYIFLFSLSDGFIKVIYPSKRTSGCSHGLRAETSRSRPRAHLKIQTVRNWAVVPRDAQLQAVVTNFWIPNIPKKPQQTEKLCECCSKIIREILSQAV